MPVDKARRAAMSADDRASILQSNATLQHQRRSAAPEYQFHSQLAKKVSGSTEFL